jgi:hypothetical protein
MQRCQLSSDALSSRVQGIDIKGGGNMILTAVTDAFERPARQRRRAALDDARLQPHFQHVGLRRC